MRCEKRNMFRGYALTVMIIIGVYWIFKKSFIDDYFKLIILIYSSMIEVRSYAIGVVLKRGINEINYMLNRY
jgi:hypothetical protein